MAIIWLVVAALAVVAFFWNPSQIIIAVGSTLMGLSFLADYRKEKH